MAEPKDEKPKLPLAGLMALLFCGGQQPDHLSGPHQDVATDRQGGGKLPRLFASASSPGLAGSVRGSGDPSAERKAAGGGGGMNTIPHPASSMEPNPARYIFLSVAAGVCGWESLCQWCGIEVARSLCVGVGAGRRRVSAGGRRIHPVLRMELDGECVHDRTLQNGSFLGQGSPKLDEQGKQEAQHILVLWLKEQDLGSKPLHELTCLVSYLKDKLKRTALCPSNSGAPHLRYAKRHAGGTQTDCGHAKPVASASLSGAQFYSSWATAADR